MADISGGLIAQTQSEFCELADGHVRFSGMVARNLTGDVRGTNAGCARARG